MTAAVTRIESDVLARICADKLAHVAACKAETPLAYTHPTTLVPSSPKSS